MDRWNLLAVVCAFLSAFLPIIFFLATSEYWKALEEKNRARRLANARMNARLLRFDI